MYVNIRLLYVNIYGKLIFQITKLGLNKRNHLVNFYISLEKRKKLRYICNSMTDREKFRLITQNVSLPVDRRESWLCRCRHDYVVYY